MLIGIVSDTHDDLAALGAAVDLFESAGVDAVVHCGDFVAPFSVTPFDIGGDDAPEFYAVRGNNDGEWAVESTVESFGEYLGEAGTLSFDSRAGHRCGTGFGRRGGHPRNERRRRRRPRRLWRLRLRVPRPHPRPRRRGARRYRPGEPGGMPIPVEGADDAFHVATLDTTGSGVDAVEHHRLNITES